MRFYCVAYILLVSTISSVFSMEIKKDPVKKKSLEITFKRDPNDHNNILLVSANPLYQSDLKLWKNPLYNPNYGKHSSVNENSYLLRDKKDDSWRVKSIGTSDDRLDRDYFESQKNLAIIAAKNYMYAYDFPKVKFSLDFIIEQNKLTLSNSEEKDFVTLQTNLALACIEIRNNLKAEIEKISSEIYDCDECEKDALDRVEWHGCPIKKISILNKRKQGIKNVWGYLLKNELIPSSPKIEQRLYDAESFGKAYAQTKGIMTLATTRAKPENIELWKQLQKKA